MDQDLIIPGSRTKSSLALTERHRRRNARRVPVHRPSRDAKPLEASIEQFVPKALAGTPSTSTISDVSRRMGLTPRAIRLYEEMGLIACGRGPRNMRVLDAGAQERLQTIVDLKALGLMVSEIADMLSRQATDPRALRRLIEARLETIEQQRAAIAAFISRLPNIDERDVGDAR